MDIQSSVVLFLVIAAIVTVSIFMSMQKKEKKIDISEVPNDSLRPLVQKLLDKIENMELQDIKLRDQIAALQLMSGIEREQTKYLTANVNKTQSV